MTNVCLFSPTIVILPILNSYNLFHASVVSATAVILAIDIVFKQKLFHRHAIIYAGVFDVFMAPENVFKLDIPSTRTFILR
jgi:hypothetical protein